MNRGTILVVAALLVPAAARAQDSAAAARGADSAIARLLRTDDAPYLDYQDAAQRWDEGRWFNFVKRSASEDAGGTELFACLVRLAPAAAPPRCLAVPLPGLDPEATTDMVNVEDFAVSDLDGDGESEFRMLVVYEGPLPEGGMPDETDEHTRLVVVDATPALHVAFAREIRLMSFRSALRNLETRASWSDVDGDGHGDLVVAGQSCAPRRPDAGCRPVRQEFTWSAAADTWRPRPAGRR